MPPSMPPWRTLLLLALLPLGACTAETVVVGGIAGGVVPLVLTGRTGPDHVVGWATGQDCSAVRLERGGPWCVTPPPPPGPPPYCTRSRGAVDCWTAAPPEGGMRPVADPPR